MPGQALEESAQQIAEIIRRVGRRSDIEDEVAQSVSFADLATELIKEEGPVREAAIRVVAKTLTELDVESGSDLETSIIDAVEWSEFVKTLTDDAGVKAGLRKAVVAAIEGGTDGNNDFTDVVDTAFGLDDSDRLVEVLGQDNKTELDGIVAKSTLKYLEGLDVSDLDDSVLDELKSALFTPERINETLVGQESELRPLVAKFALEVVEKADPSDNDDPLLGKVLESPILQQAVDAAVTAFVRGGQIEGFVGQAMEKILQDPKSPLRSQIERAVSESLVGKIAESVVSRLFERRH